MGGNVPKPVARYARTTNAFARKETVLTQVDALKKGRALRVPAEMGGGSSAMSQETQFARTANACATVAIVRMEGCAWRICPGNSPVPICKGAWISLVVIDYHVDRAD